MLFLITIHTPAHTHQHTHTSIDTYYIIILYYYIIIILYYYIVISEWGGGVTNGLPSRGPPYKGHLLTL